MEPKYKHIYLTNVILRIDLANKIVGIDKGLTKNLSKKILQYFPILEPQQVAEGTVEITPGQIKSNAMKKSTNWKFHGREREKVFTVSESFISVEYKKYMGFELMKAEFLDILSMLVTEISYLQFSRFGMRYINNIELDEKDPTDWSKYISTDLLSIFSVPNADETVTRAFNILSTKKDEISINFQYGMHNPDYPAPIKRKIFILDIDAFYQGGQDESDIKNYVNTFHERIRNYFMSSITEELEKKMKHE